MAGFEQPHADAFYYHVAAGALDTAKKIATDGQDLDPNETEFARKAAIVTAMVFSAMCLEAYINHCYADSRLVSKRIEKLSVALKWTKFPLFTGHKKTFDETKEPFLTFRDLIATRNNRLVHFKPSLERAREGSTSQFREGYTSLVGSTSTAERYFSNVAAMIKELSSLTGGNVGVPDFLTGPKYIAKVVSYVRVNAEIVNPAGDGS
jgi:hypothetical protein